jgi:hypothetical protein
MALAAARTEELIAELRRRGEVLAVRVLEAPPVTPVLTLEQLYNAIRIDDPEADVPVIIEGTLAAGAEVWLGPIPLSPRVCVQRFFTLWGNPVVQVAFGIDTKERLVGPFYLPPNATQFEFVKYWVKKTVYIYLRNTDTTNPSEFHIIVSSVMPLLSEWNNYWWPRIKKQVEALKGVGT